jgi:thiol-disulfide isomerase/thioredoxin
MSSETGGNSTTNATSKPSSPLSRQLPPGVFMLLLVVAALAIFYVVGKATPTTIPRSTEFASYGKVIGDFTATTVDDKPFRFSDHKGKVILINYWATWCGPCVMEVPDIVKLQKKYGPKGFVVLGISADDPGDIPKVKQFIAKTGINYPVMLAPKELLQQTGIPGALPTSFLVDKSGKIVDEFVGVDSRYTPEYLFGTQIEKYL